MSNNLNRQLEAIHNTLSNNDLPLSIPDMKSNYQFTPETEAFKQYCQNTHKMYGLVDLTWTEEFARELKNMHVLEIMAGRGWLAKALAHHGICVHATDGLKGYEMECVDSVFPVTIMTAKKAIKDHAAYNDALLCSWPPYDEPAFRLALQHWPHDKPIYVIGEGLGGCTADDKFWLSYAKDKDWYHPNHSGQHSRIYRGYWP